MPEGPSSDYATFAVRERTGWADSSIIDNYLAWFGPITDAVAELLTEIAMASGARRALDLCCDNGTLAGLLWARGAEVSALDFSTRMLAQAKARVPEASFTLEDAQALPYDGASFHAVVCNFGIPHIPDQGRALGEIRRVLRPGGVAAISAWVGPEASPAFDILFRAIKAHADLSSMPPQPDLFRFSRREAAEELLGQAGLSLRTRTRRGRVDAHRARSAVRPLRGRGGRRLHADPLAARREGRGDQGRDGDRGCGGVRRRSRSLSRPHPGRDSTARSD